MSYFENTKFVPYKFGTSNEFTLHQNLGVYVDLIDQVRDNNSFYQRYTILDGDRPDVLSQKIYNSPKFYWTFFLMNDKIRESGWPLSNQGVIKLAKKERPNTVLTTRDDLTGIFKVGSTVTGETTLATGKIIKRNLDLGQIYVEGDVNFNSTENIINENGETNIVKLVGAVEEYNAVWRYEDVNGEQIDIDPYIGPGSEVTPKTFIDRYLSENDALKDIIVIKPDAINSVFEQFQNAMGE